MTENVTFGEFPMDFRNIHPESIIKCLNHNDWYGALNLLEPLSLSACSYDDTTVDNLRKVVYLSWRSECFFKTDQYENCAVDCRRIMRLLPKEDSTNSFWFMSRWRLIHCLTPLNKPKAIKEAKSVVQELINVCEGFIKHECVNLLEEMEIDEPNDQISRRTRSSNHSKKRADVSINSPFRCIFCDVALADEDELGKHYWTKSHFQTIMSDVGRDWRKRPPSAIFGSPAGTYYRLCPGFLRTENGTCQHGSQCENAHGIEELHEWRERFEYRRMKLLAEETLRYRKSYAKLFLKKLAETPHRETLMKESLDYVDVEIEGDLNAIVYMQKINKTWILKMKTSRVLQAVVLLYSFDKSRIILNRITASLTKNEKDIILLDEKPIKVGEWISPFIEIDKNDDEVITYEVEVVHLTDSEGIFSQSVLFDFGHTPVLTKKLRVHVAFASEVERIKNLLEVSQEMESISTKMWTINNASIVFFGTSRGKEFLTKYCIPKEQNYLLTESLLDDDLTANNYRSRMHNLLYIEETTLYGQITKFNNPSTIQVAHSRPVSTGTERVEKCSVNGELFLLFHLRDTTCQKWRVGRLFLNNCTTALVGDSREVSRKNTKNQKPTVYEALIEEIDQQRNIVYLRLSARMVSDMKLNTETGGNYTGLLNVQFQIDRRSIYRSHQAIDNLSDLDIIFPDMLQKINLADIVKTTIDICYNLNQIQKKAFDIITLPRYIILPPVLLLGNHGSGITYTLAQAVKQILMEKNSKILICTYSNRAADLFVKDYLDPYVKSGTKEATPLRIYHRNDKVSPVHSAVLEYCLIEIKNDSRSFKIPTLEDVWNHRIIVSTLRVVSYLSNIDLPKGYFTHMLIEEASDTLECQTILPLTLATKKTRIVLAGDIQRPDGMVHSLFAKQKKFNVSLLRRLFSSYPSTYPLVTLDKSYRIVLPKPNHNVSDKQQKSDKQKNSDEQQKSVPADASPHSNSPANIRPPIIVPSIEKPWSFADLINFESLLPNTPQTVLKPIGEFQSQVEKCPKIYPKLFSHLGVSRLKSSQGVYVP